MFSRKIFYSTFSRCESKISVISTLCTVYSTVWKNDKFTYCHQKTISSNQLFSIFFSKNVTFTKFLSKKCDSTLLDLLKPFFRKIRNLKYHNWTSKLCLHQFLYTMDLKKTIPTIRNCFSCQKKCNKVGQNLDLSKKLISSLVTIFTILLLDAKCAILCGKPLDRMKIY